MVMAISSPAPSSSEGKWSSSGLTSHKVETKLSVDLDMTNSVGAPMGTPFLPPFAREDLNQGSGVALGPPWSFFHSFYPLVTPWLSRTWSTYKVDLPLKLLEGISIYRYHQIQSKNSRRNNPQKMGSIFWLLMFFSWTPPCQKFHS